MKSLIPTKIILASCALGAAAIAFRALRLLSLGVVSGGSKVAKGVKKVTRVKIT